MKSNDSNAPQTLVIILDGEFDLTERGRLTDAFSVASSAKLVIVDFEKTAYVDSTVLNCLIALEAETRKRNGRVVLTGLRAPLERIFKLCNLSKVFDIRRSISDVREGDLYPSSTLTLVAHAYSSVESGEFGLGSA